MNGTCTALSTLDGELAQPQQPACSRTLEARGPASWAQEYGPPLFRFALAHVRDADAAAEVVQETFLAALEGGKTFEGRSSFRTWLLGIARFKTMDYFRLRSRERASGDLCEEPDGSSEGAVGDVRGLQIGSAAIDPEEAVAASALEEALHSALARLSPRLAQAFVLSALKGLDGDEACAILGCTRSTLWVRLHRARRKLRRALEGSGLVLPKRYETCGRRHGRREQHLAS